MKASLSTEIQSIREEAKLSKQEFEALKEKINKETAQLRRDLDDNKRMLSKTMIVLSGEHIPVRFFFNFSF